MIDWGKKEEEFIETSNKMIGRIFGACREEVIDVRMKKGSNFKFEHDVLFKVTKGDIIDIMCSNDKTFNEHTLDIANVWMEDWSDFEINGYKVYNVDYEMNGTNLIDHRWRISYSMYMGSGMGGGTWEFNGDLVSELRDIKLKGLGI